MMQCQDEVGRFATRPEQLRITIDTIRKRTNERALFLIKDGDVDGALREMLDGLARQAPLTFRAPTVSR